MIQTTIFMPIFVLVGFSYVIAALMLKERIHAVKGGLQPGYFLYNRGGKPPESMLKVSHHYENLFELPVLFYIVCISLYATAHVNPLNLTLAWVFVISRFAHAYIHIGKNRLLQRRNIFLLSSVVLLCMWVEFMLGLEFFI